MGIDLSVVIPAFNEVRRLPPYLDNIHFYLNEQFNLNYEIIVVDDGSHDNLPSVLSALMPEWEQLTVLRHPANRGKGFAVRRGVLAAHGAMILFADADGATPIEEERKLRTAILEGADLAVGSRFLDVPGVSRSRRWQRKLAGRLFARLARVYLSVLVCDTQCGFKMFRRDVGLRLFESCREDGYLFDLHVLALAQRLGYHAVEIPIRWRDVPGSKIRLFRDSLRMVLGLWKVRRSVEAATKWDGSVGHKHSATSR